MPNAPAEAFTSIVQVMAGTVASVGLNAHHGVGKRPSESIRLLTGLGVEGDAHCGALVQQRWLKKKDPTLPNRTQVHLLHEELFAELSQAGVEVAAGQLGENVTTRGIDLLRLPVGARLRLGDKALIEITGLHEPCSQLNRIYPGLLKRLRYHEAGIVIRKAGVMAIVLRDGEVTAGAAIIAEMPDPPWKAMGPV